MARYILAREENPTQYVVINWDGIRYTNNPEHATRFSSIEEAKYHLEAGYWFEKFNILPIEIKLEIGKSIGVISRSNNPG